MKAFLNVVYEKKLLDNSVYASQLSDVSSILPNTKNSKVFREIQPTSVACNPKATPILSLDKYLTPIPIPAQALPSFPLPAPSKAQSRCRSLSHKAAKRREKA
mmetsp:Transcript_25194/g.29036  ORF Transcript_25194/g.29036 Transcript_25194/m.29036 type:complete len:103 (+) Transcript_25194:387-695(+)